MSSYDASQITVLEGLEAVRRRPGMYVGDLHDGSGLHHMLWEVLGNAIDEHLGGHASKVLVSIKGDEVVVDDNGRGVSVERLPNGSSILERILTTLCGSGTRDGHHPHVHIGTSLYGVGLAAVNALCVELEVETHYRGRRHRISCERGRVVGAASDLGPTRRQGTRVRFRPDPTIFSSTGFDLAHVRKRLYDLACLNPALELHFQHDELEVLHAPGGLVDLVRGEVMDENAYPYRPLRLLGAHDNVLVEVALQWLPEGRPREHGFVSQFRAPEGSHVRGLWKGLCAAWSSARPHDRIARPVMRELLGQGLVAAVHVGLYDARFDSPTRSRLDSPEAERAVCTLVHRGLESFFRAAGAGTPLVQRFARHAG
ncbi:MAG TPA: ATP-binding protein [Polyangiaceae bacterium]|nr:ATP-binding protein [Polyangiaceae bacterium]